MMRHAANLPDVRLIDVKPRYYPSQRWIVRVPGLREVAMWNCVLILERNG
jgi:arabinofuranan 3-O-arabinosyltransferase